MTIQIQNSDGTSNSEASRTGDYLKQSEYDSYLARESLINKDKAEAYIRQLLAAKVHQFPQLELFAN